ncbi:hypothetical protein SCHPADRAFT_820397 [Schizopora paradoxa]|uniref:Uncharacterized protein n=1 Tax=Schizopora paradoxa TaxID=27342 RepID=A0A0H2S156_9AGAM|nr:hypothetical protein SCHPADRAFT_820397 [Schizopora paradoxa]
MKRSYDAMNDSDEEILLGRRSLPVANLPDDFDGVPQDGMQYLFTVRRDARSLPKFTRAPLPSESSRQPLSSTAVSKSEDTVTPRVMPQLLPSLEWRSAFITKFKYLRKNCEPILDSINAPMRQDQTTAGRAMPEKKERDKWRAFIDGHPESVWNPPRKPKVLRGAKKGNGLRAWKDDSSTYDDLRSFEYGEAYGTHESYGASSSGDNIIVVNEYGEAFNDEHGNDESSKLLPTPSHTPQPEERQASKAGQGYPSADSSDIQEYKSKSMSPRQPTPQLISKMDNQYCLHLLMYFTYWIDMHLKQEHPRSSHLSRTHARWMFALLSRVDAQLSSDEMSQLRNLARSCFALIRDLRRNPQDYEASEFTTEEPVDEKACWLIVTAVLEFWVQRDLWMDAENLLRKE